MINKKQLIFLDTETTGRDKEDRLCEVAYKFYGDKTARSEFFKPYVSIKLEAMAVHHITEKVVADKERFSTSGMWKRLKNLLESTEILVAHYAKFDVDMLKKEYIDPKRVICTMKVGRFLDTNDEMTSYSMQYMRHYYNIEADVYEHSAEGDVFILEKLFDIFLKKLSIEEMLKITREPFLLRKLTFGKHKGIPFEQIPFDYLLWLRKQSELGEDLEYTLNYYIANR